jgi:hypothetical protein
MIRIKNFKFENKLKLYICIILVVLIIVNVITLLVYLNYNKLSSEIVSFSEINITFMVGNTSGFVVESKYLDFGRITPDGASSKKMTIFPLSKQARVYIDFSQNIEKYANVDKNNFIFYPKNISQELDISISNVNDLEFGNYSGKMYIYYSQSPLF